MMTEYQVERSASARNDGGRNTRAPEHENTKETCWCWSKVNEALIKVFNWFGHLVGQYPIYFVVFPLVISVILSTGLAFMTFEEDPVKLFIPYDAPSLQEQQTILDLYPVNYTENFSASRFTRHEGHSRVIVTARDGGSILRAFLWEEIIQVDELVNSIPVTDKDGNELVYKDICAMWRGQCTPNTALNINEEIYLIENGSVPINYPLMVFPLILPQFLGGISINKTDGYITDAKAILLLYFTNVQNPEKIDIALQWERNLVEIFQETSFENITVSLYTSRSIQDELKVKMDSCLPFLPLTGFIMVLTCMLMLWMSDCVRSKPLIGVVGLFSALMAAGASFGFLMYLGAPNTRLNVVALFLVLGIGVDDMFVAISAWQKTSLGDSVPKRIAKTYADAAVSVTITSVTNCLAFAVGTSTPIFIVKSFCLYCGVTIAFAYVWFITFCGGFLAISGYLEEQRRHSLFFVKVKPLSESGKKNPFKRFFFSSDLVEQDQSPGGVIKVKPHAISIFFRDTVGDLLQNKFFRVFIGISCLVYLGGAIYGCVILKQGLYRDRMARDDSYLTQFSRNDDLYFRHLPYAVQVVIHDNITYSDEETQKKLLDFITQFEESEYGSETVFTQSWLRGYLSYLKRNRKLRKEITDEESFIKGLQEKYFTNPRDQNVMDVRFNENLTRITSSRFVIQVGKVDDVFDDVVMMNTFRKIAEDSPFNATVLHVLFNLFDQHALMKELALQSIFIAVVLVMAVSIIFIPNPWGSIGIAFSIVSIATGVIGYMAYWDINLDHVSVGSIFMCIGFSVDFSAHISYTFLSSNEPTVEGKVRQSLFGLGLPIVQGATTTILSLITFLAIPGYGYRTFFKTIFMVNLFAIYHSIFLIPLFLSWLMNSSLNCRKNERPISELDKAKTPKHGHPIAITAIRSLDDEDTINHNGINGKMEGVYYKNGSIKPYSKKGVDNNLKNTKNSINNATKLENGVDNRAYLQEETD